MVVVNLCPKLLPKKPILDTSCIGADLKNILGGSSGIICKTRGVLSVELKDVGERGENLHCPILSYFYIYCN